MSVVKTLNGNMICSIGIRTTGDNAQVDEIYDLCIMPLDKNLDPMPSKVFHRGMDVREENKDKIKSKKILVKKSPSRVYDELDLWFEDNLKAGKILPLCYNYVFQKSFLLMFLQEGYNYYFLENVRDIKNTAIYLNDLAESNGKMPLPFPKNTFRYIANSSYVELDRDYSAFEAAKVTAECYKKMCNLDMSRCLLAL